MMPTHDRGPRRLDRWRAHFSTTTLLLVLLVVSPLFAHAADQTVLGSLLLVKDPSTPDKRQITAKATEIASDDSIVGDPSSTGATLTISVGGGTPSSETYAMPTGVSAVSGKPFWSGSLLAGFKYKDAKSENGPVKVAQIRAKSGVFQIKAVITAKVDPVAVHPPDPGTDGCVLLGIVGGDSYS